MVDEKRAESARILRYFWEEKGDIERWTGFNRDDLAAHAPDVLSAWDALKEAEKTMSRAIDANCEKWQA